MSVVTVKTFEKDHHTYVVGADDAGQVHVAVDGGPDAKGYYFGGTVRFPKGLHIGEQIQMSLTLDCDAEIQKGFAAAKQAN
ncbi:hypothetical protein [Lactiplantibacillus xiangfangensis]|jgi:hypothetical protein|uniref:Uncharacterized protein n=1 Tax=Lactiplantibacillus xiangfangensis TaxID=942150 RepID=A0A0R2M2P3_9LACO|nr:hypothetical protein [Lactiplantibacillus xiangfangensis]KRO07782.1 hypothetical protein IV64_GL001236 [Lactiplantibacillus xiangfangensis]